MKLLVCGGRTFENAAFVYETLDGLHASRPVTRLIEGGAKGADKWAKRWATERGIAVVTYPANWAKYGNAAGPIRNEEMLAKELPELVVAFPGDKGTRNMVERARERGVTVAEVAPMKPRLMEDRETRTRQYNVRMTEEEMEMLVAVSKATGETAGVLVRRWLREAHKAVKP